MKKLFVKICGITNVDDALAAAQCGADAVGFIFYESSKRCISPPEAAAIIRELPEIVLPVGVFVNTVREVIESVIEKTGIRIVQLHGDEGVDDCRGFGIQTWKGVRFRREEELETISNYDVDAFVFDAYSHGSYGGSGALSDWGLARAMAQRYRVILAGGLSPENIVDAVQTVRPFGVDINSGVEVSPGTKNHRKIRAVMEKLRSVQLDTYTPT